MQLVRPQSPDLGWTWVQRLHNCQQQRPDHSSGRDTKSYGHDRVFWFHAIVDLQQYLRMNIGALGSMGKKAKCPECFNNVVPAFLIEISPLSMLVSVLGLLNLSLPNSWYK